MADTFMCWRDMNYPAIGEREINYHAFDSMTKVRQTEDNFNTEAYIGRLQNFSEQSCRQQDKFRKFLLDFQHDVFKNGQITGDRLLDVGTGPVCYGVYAPSRWFREITLSDLSKSSLTTLRAWKDGKRKDLDSIFNYMIQLDGNRESLTSAHERLRQQVKTIIPCDLRKENLLAGTEAENSIFDAIILQLSQSLAFLTYDEHKNGVLRYSRHLKPGGHVIVIDVLETSYYTVSDTTYCSGVFTREEIQSLYRECGYEILFWRVIDDLYEPNSEKVTDLRVVYGMVARKL